MAQNEVGSSPMLDWQDQPANRMYKRALAELRIAVPQWWPSRPHVDVVGGDINAGAVILHLPYEGDPYLARLPVDGSYPGNTGTTVRALQEQRHSYEWADDQWRWILLSRHQLTPDDIEQIRRSMSDAPTPTNTQSGRT